MLWIIFLCLTVAVLLALLRPLFVGAEDGSGRAAANAQVYRDQLKEVDSDRERGLIGEPEAKAARLEIERRLLATADSGKRDGADGGATLSGPPVWMAIVVAVCLPLIVLGFYLSYGSPTLPDQPLMVRLEQPVDQRNVGELVARVEARLRRNPQDGEGWAVVAPIYAGARRYDQAIDAYRKAIRYSGAKPDLLAGLGEALVFAENGTVNDNSKQILERAIAGNPTLIKPRILLAYGDEQAGRFDAAVDRWKALQKLVEDDDRWKPVVAQRLAAAEAQRDGKPANQSLLARKDRGPDADDVAAAQSLSAQGRQQMIEGMVAQLSDRLDKNGDDLDGWMQLVRSYAVLKRPDDAKVALAKAKTHFTNEPSALARLNALAEELDINS